MWLRDLRCAEVVQEAWMERLYKIEGTPITNCLDSCRARLTSWNKLEFGHVGRPKARLEQELQALDHKPQQSLELIQEVRQALDYWLDTKNTMWLQRAKQMWITYGDRNTSFFHQKASNRKQKNFIKGLTGEHGIWQTDDHSMEQITLGYFSNIFHSNGPTDTSVVVAAIKPVVTDSMNRFLCQPFRQMRSTEH